MVINLLYTILLQYYSVGVFNIVLNYTFFHNNNWENLKNENKQFNNNLPFI